MSDSIIEVRNLGKKYIINHQRESYTSLRDVMANKVKNFGKKKIQTGEKEEFWALKDVSFDIKQGDKVGIIGRNGAGKSTLLKLLSRITEPTTGSIAIKGRVASLLEVGTGFHPELTGRENIYLNGAILGMGRQEIKKKFNEIVEFAEVEKFLDTPVKRYSSGMYVRLAFSVAAHLEPEILIVDEVLAVGDAQFQKKCLGKMGDVSKDGRTVIFVSHNMGAIQQLCEKGIFLNKGTLSCIDKINEVICCYEAAPKTKDIINNLYISKLGLYVNKVNLKAEEDRIQPFKSLQIHIELFAEVEVKGVALNITISNKDYRGFIFSTSTMPHNNVLVNLHPGENKFTCYINSLDICSGEYQLGFGVSIPMVETIYFNDDFMSFKIEETIIKGSTLQSDPAYGLLYLEHDWRIEK